MGNSQWHVFDITYTTLLKKYECCEDRYSYMRRSTSRFTWSSNCHVVVLVAPRVMQHILSTCSFLVPPDSGERLNHGLTTFLALSVFSLTIGEKVPEWVISLPLVCKYSARFLLCDERWSKKLFSLERKIIKYSALIPLFIAAVS